MAFSILRFFSSKHLFARIIIYILLSVILQKFYAEILLREASFYHPQVKQWIFFSLMTFDYIINIPKLLRIKFKLNSSTIFSFLCIFMILHGAIVGILNHNRPFVIFNDIVPFLMVALNILRMASLDENKKEINLEFLLRFASIAMLFSTLVSFILKMLHVTDHATYYFDTIYSALFFAFLFGGKKIPKFDIFAFITVSAFASTQTNRTTMLFLVLIAMMFFLKLFFRNYLKGIGVIVSVISILGMGFLSLPEDSMTYRRITQLSKIDFSEKTGSVGERQAEWDAVDQKLEKMGPTAELTGLGMGGVYDVQFTHQFNKDYGHAHYSWVWFKMRFGQIGYFYLLIFTLMLCINAYQHWKIKGTLNYFIFFLCLFSFLYLMTYVNAIFLLSGIQFASIIIRDKISTTKKTPNSCIS